jgi:gluconokinase
MSNKIPAAILIMGVSGSGKSTVGKKLAEILSWSFIDGDDYHSPENITKMRGGIPLTDSDRAGWLRDLHELLRQHVEENTPVILACSALKKVYREKLGAGIPGLKIVYLRGDFKLILRRIQEREGHYMGAEMLKSQFGDLEQPAQALTIEVNQDTDSIVGEIIKSLGLRRNNPT